MEIPAAAEPAAESSNPSPKSTPPEAKSFYLKAKGVMLVIGALGTAATAIFGAVKKPEEKIAKEAYETLKKKVEEQATDIRELHDDVTELTGYLHAVKDLSGAPGAAPLLPSPVVSAFVPQLPLVHPPAIIKALPSVGAIVSKAEAK